VGALSLAFRGDPCQPESEVVARVAGKLFAPAVHTAVSGDPELLGEPFERAGEAEFRLPLFLGVVVATRRIVGIAFFVVARVELDRALLTDIHAVENLQGGVVLCTEQRLKRVLVERDGPELFLELPQCPCLVTLPLGVVGPLKRGTLAREPVVVPCAADPHLFPLYHQLHVGEFVGARGVAVDTAFLCEPSAATAEGFVAIAKMGLEVAAQLVAARFLEVQFLFVLLGERRFTIAHTLTVVGFVVVRQLGAGGRVILYGFLASSHTDDDNERLHERSKLCGHRIGLLRSGG